MDGCPVGVPIPEFIHHVAEGEFEEAYQTITRENAFEIIKQFAKEYRKELGKVPGEIMIFLMLLV